MELTSVEAGWQTCDGGYTVSHLSVFWNVSCSTLPCGTYSNIPDGCSWTLSVWFVLMCGGWTKPSRRPICVGCVRPRVFIKHNHRFSPNLHITARASLTFPVFSDIARPRLPNLSHGVNNSDISGTTRLFIPGNLTTICQLEASPSTLVITPSTVGSCHPLWGASEVPHLQFCPQWGKKCQHIYLTRSYLWCDHQLYHPVGTTQWAGMALQLWQRTRAILTWQQFLLADLGLLGGSWISWPPTCWPTDYRSDAVVSPLLEMAGVEGAGPIPGEIYIYIYIYIYRHTHTHTHTCTHL